jgi:hypothetical protein
VAPATFEFSQWREIAKLHNITVVKNFGDHDNKSIERNLDILKKISEREDLLSQNDFNSNLLLIFDDCMCAPKKLLRSKRFIDLWENDGLTMMISAQYIVDLSPLIRKVLDVKMVESKICETKFQRKHYSELLVRSEKKLDEICQPINNMRGR